MQKGEGNHDLDGTAKHWTSPGPPTSGPLSLHVEATVSSVKCHLHQYLTPWFLYLYVDILILASDDYFKDQMR